MPSRVRFGVPIAQRGAISIFFFFFAIFFNFFGKVFKFLFGFGLDSVSTFVFSVFVNHGDEYYQ